MVVDLLARHRPAPRKKPAEESAQKCLPAARMLPVPRASCLPRSMKTAVKRNRTRALRHKDRKRTCLRTPYPIGVVGRPRRKGFVQPHRTIRHRTIRHRRSPVFRQMPPCLEAARPEHRSAPIVFGERPTNRWRFATKFDLVGQTGRLRRRRRKRRMRDHVGADLRVERRLTGWRLSVRRRGEGSSDLRRGKGIQVTALFIGK